MGGMNALHVPRVGDMELYEFSKCPAKQRNAVICTQNQRKTWQRHKGNICFTHHRFHSLSFRDINTVVRTREAFHAAEAHAPEIDFYFSVFLLST
ncbi:hypothetical protein XELAEV_18043424mg [Xenopus laevis]|uniref:Uncharacterized protein n=1 Tax=Xenopus laevis TaxID=8355 RepID=A0A974H2C6_XENLA|nr:hypothetical protein XELAEV_18043424mg [Xenopus laevis]